MALGDLDYEHLSLSLFFFSKGRDEKIILLMFFTFQSVFMYTQLYSHPASQGGDETYYRAHLHFTVKEIVTQGGVRMHPRSHTCKLLPKTP